MGKQTSDAAVLAVRFEARIWREASTGTREERQEDGSYKDVEIAFPAEWAGYDVESGVRLAYSKSEEGAKKAAEKWNDGKIPELIANKAESARDLKKLLKPGDTVSTILRQVSRSGMSRRISCVIARDSEVIDITWDVARASGDPVKQGGKYVQDAGLVVGGCGMDMGFHVVYNLGRTLWPDGFACAGATCPSNDHFNRDPETGKTMPRTTLKANQPIHKGDGGYALHQRWM